MATKPRYEFPMPQVSWSLETLAFSSTQSNPRHIRSNLPNSLTKASSPPRYSFASFSQILSSLLNILLRQSWRSIETYGPAIRFQMDQCKRILKLPGEYSIWSHLGSSRKAMDRQAVGDVAAAVTPASHPNPNMRWRRCNPMSKLRRRKSKATAIPHVHGQNVDSVRPAATRAAKLNYVNPLYYIRQIKNNLTNSKRQRIPA